MNLSKTNSVFSLLIAAMAFVTGCSVSDSEGDDYSKWTFSGSVVNGSTGIGLDGATIEYVDDSGKQKT